VGGVRAEQHQSLAAVLQQARHRALLVAIGGDGAERQLVAEPVGRAVEPADQIAVEGVLDPEHHAEQPAAVAAQPPGPGVRTVAQLVRRPQDPLPGPRAGPGHVPDHDRDQRHRHPGPGGHVGQRGAAPIRPGH